MECRVDLIIGKNASGKTKILKDDLDLCIKKGMFCVANFSENMLPMLQKLKVDTSVVDDINDMLDYQNLKVVGNSVAVELKTENYELKRVSEQLNRMITIITKKCDCIFLDEPELLLSKGEVLFLCKCLNCISKYRYIEYVTHSRDMLACISDNEFYIKKVGDEFVKTLITEGTIYDYLI